MEKGESNHVSQLSKGASGLVLCALLAAPALAEGPIKIGVPVGLSGANSVVAPSVVQSAELAVEEINKAGGVLGRTLALEVADDGSGAAGAQKAFDSLIFQKKVTRSSAWRRARRATPAWRLFSVEDPLHLYLVL